MIETLLMLVLCAGIPGEPTAPRIQAPALAPTSHRPAKKVVKVVKKLVVLTGGNWCGACNAMRPIEAQLEHDGYKLEIINTDNNPQAVKQWQVSAVPTFVMTVDGKEVSRIVGSTSIEQLKQTYGKQ